MKKLTNAKDLIEALKTQDPESYKEIKNSTKEVAKKWGGKRTNAGKKPKDPNNVLIFQMRVSENERDFLRYARDNHIDYKKLMQG